MAISPISSSTVVQQTSPVGAAEAGEATRGGKDIKNDGDADDAGGAAAPAAAPRPTTNTVGQVIGQHLNVKA